MSFQVTFPHKKTGRLVALGALAIVSPVMAQGTTPPSPPAQTQPAAPTIDPAAQKLLEKTIKYYSSLKSYSTKVEMQGIIYNLEYQAPQSLRLTLTDQNGKLLMAKYVSPTEMVLLQPREDATEWILTKHKTPADAKTALNSGLTVASLLSGHNPFADNMSRVSSLKLEPVTTVNNVKVTPLVGVVSATKESPFKQTVTIFIDSKNVVQGSKIALEAPDGKKFAVEEKFLTKAFNGKIPASDFVFTPPAGSKQVNEFTLPPAQKTIEASVGQIVKPFNTKDLDGKEISFDQYQGKVVLIDFWATWCGPCKAELPNVKAAYKKYKDQGFDVIGISLDQKEEPLTKYIKDNELPWRQIFDGYWNGPIAKSYSVTAIPSTLLIGKDGKIAAVDARGEELAPAIEAALAAPAPTE